MRRDTDISLQELRRLRGIQLAKARRIIETADCWLVNSRVGSRKYKVTLKGAQPTCTCPDFDTNRKKCKHIYAVEYIAHRRRVAAKPQKGFVKYEEEVVDTPRPTYDQNWPAYNAAQMNEETLFLTLLSDLCKALPITPRKPGGQQLQLSDAIFACTYKVYSTLSGRRFMTSLRDAHQKGYVSQPIHYNSISKQLCREELTSYLTDMIETASKPMSVLDTCFAVDSTGIGSSQFVRWFSLKYNRDQDNHDWLKLHIACGVVTNVITAVEVSDRTKHDSPLLPSLVKTTQRNFKIAEVSADKGYTSRRNLKAVVDAGAEPYIMFKSHHTGRGTPTGKGEGVELWRNAWHFFHMERDAFLEKYRRRSNVESTFHMIKSKFGHSMRSKTDVSQMNEVLCKALCHNICVLIQAMFEYGVIPSFLTKSLPNALHEQMVATSSKGRGQLTTSSKR